MDPCPHPIGYIIKTNDKWNHFFLGYAYEKNGNFEKAKEHYEIAITNENREKISFWEKAGIQKDLGRVYGLLGKYDQAVKELENCKSTLINSVWYLNILY